MFTAKLHNITQDEEFVGYVTIDEVEPKIVDISTGFDMVDELEAGIAENLEEIVDLHDAMLNDPDTDDVMGVEFETPDHQIISVSLTDEEDE